MKRTIIDASQMELEDKVVSIKRVTKVVKGGRNFRFTALVVVGDKNGHVGAGLGKASEIPEAIRKGKEDATKKLISLPMDENGSIPHDFIGNFGSASVLLKRAPEGIEATMEGQNIIFVRGIDKEKVGQYAAEIRDKRRPEPYKGKGIKYADEVIRRKVGKTGKK